eukprot:349839-Chlamydomonas_euryale.AAC.5
MVNGPLFSRSHTHHGDGARGIGATHSHLELCSHLSSVTKLEEHAVTRRQDDKVSARPAADAVEHAATQLRRGGR